jgi:vanillate O-demethylase monooxygenase subunit
MKQGATQLDMAGEGRLYEHLRNFWQPVAFSEDLTDSPVQVTLFGTRLAIARLDGQPYVFDDICRHRGSALSLGRIDGSFLRCAYHGWAYDKTGTVVDIPARPELSGKLVAELPVYPAVEASGLVWTCLADEPPVFPPPEFPEMHDPEYKTMRWDAYEWNCSAARRLENYFDFSHFAHVHHGILGDRDNAVIADYEVERSGSEILITAGPFIEFTDNPKNASVVGGGETYEAWKRYRVFMPNAMKLNSSAGPVEDYVLFVAVAPTSRTVTRCFTMMARNFGLDDDAGFDAFQHTILDQDRPIVESQRPEELPIELSAEMHVKAADLGTVEYRRWLYEIADGTVELAVTG